jgi:hypothetical protein
VEAGQRPKRGQGVGCGNWRDSRQFFVIRLVSATVRISSSGLIVRAYDQTGAIVNIGGVAQQVIASKSDG